MRVCLFGVAGKVGSVLGPGLEQAGHEVVDGRAAGPAGCDVAVDFTRPDALLGNAQASFARACRSSSARAASTTTCSSRPPSGQVSRVFVVPNFARRRAPDDALRGGGGPRLRCGGDRRAPCRHEARRPVGHRPCDGGAAGRRRPDPLGQAPGPRRPSGGAVRRAGGDAHDPPRHDLARGVRAGRAAGDRRRADASARPDGRARRPR